MSNLTIQELEQLLVQIQQIINSKFPKKDWLSEEEVIQEFNISRHTLNKYRNDVVNPLPYAKFEDEGRKIYYHRAMISKRLFENMIGISPREKKQWEPFILGEAR